MAKRKRDVPVLFWVSAEELELIHQKMQQYGTENLSAYLRKMALDGYVVKLELPELKELVSLMRRSSNNLNQRAQAAAQSLIFFHPFIPLSEAASCGRSARNRPAPRAGRRSALSSRDTFRRRA